LLAFLLPVSFECRQELFGISRFGPPNLLPQPFKLSKLFEEVRGKMLQNKPVCFRNSDVLPHRSKPQYTQE